MGWLIAGLFIGTALFVCGLWLGLKIGAHRDQDPISLPTIFPVKPKAYTTGGKRVPKVQDDRKAYYAELDQNP